MEDIIIYGIGAQAKQLKRYIEHDECANIHAFVVDRKYKKTDSLCDLPVIEFEEVESLYPPDEYKMLISFAYTNMMDNRKDKIEITKQKGYSLFSYISKDARVYSEKIGESVIIYPGTVIASNVNVGTGCFFEISCSIAHDTILGEYCFFAPGATVCGEVVIENNTFIGSGAVVVNSLKIGSFSFISANALVSKNVLDNSVINPNGGVSNIKSRDKKKI